MLCGAWHVVDAGHVEGFQAAQIIGCYGFGQSLNRGPVLGGLDNQLVVNIGDVHHPVDLIAFKSEVTLDCVKDHGADHVADMAVGINRWATDIHPYMRGLERDEIFFGLGQCVINPQRHGN